MANGTLSKKSPIAHTANNYIILEKKAGKKKTR